MVLKNYHEYLYSFHTNNAQHGTVIDVNGVEHEIDFSYSYYTYYLIPEIMKRVQQQLTHGLVFGSGNTEPTINDYKLSGSAVGGLGVTYSQTFTKNDDGSLDIKTVYTITNNNTSSVTIGEVACVSRTSVGSGSSPIILLERSAFDNPITLEPNEVGQAEYTVTMIKNY